MISRDFTTSYPDITISTAGKVGINTASPAYTLTVEKQVTGDWLSRIYNTGTAEGDNGVLVRADSTHDGTAVLAVYSGAYRAWFQGDGKVGIGYTDPLSAFHVKRHGGLLYNGGETSNNTIDNQASRDNYWTYHGCAGFGGTRSGNFRLTIPDCNNSASSAGYGSFSVEIYLSGYNGKYAHAFVSGYVNVSMNISESAFRASSGYHTLSYGMNGTQGFYVDIDTPGYVHGSAYWRVTKAGDPTAGRWTRLSNAVANWT